MRSASGEEAPTSRAGAADFSVMYTPAVCWPGTVARAQTRSTATSINPPLGCAQAALAASMAAKARK